MILSIETHTGKYSETMVLHYIFIVPSLVRYLNSEYNCGLQKLGIACGQKIWELFLASQSGMHHLNK